MQLIAIALSCCLLLQQPTEPDPFGPKMVPSKRPAVAIDASAVPAESTAPVTTDNPPADPFPAPAAARAEPCRSGTARE